jgi:hypothetical protein
MSTSSRKAYTRRNTRTRLIDLLKEAIELVEKGCPPGHMTREPASLANASLAKAPLSSIAEENMLSRANSLLAASRLELEKGKAFELQSKEFIETQKTKGTVRPGVLKYNEFVKNWISKHPEYQAKGKYQAALKEIQRSGNWDAVSGTRKKAKSVAPTPGRVNAKIPFTPVTLNANTTNANAANAAANAAANVAANAAANAAANVAANAAANAAANVAANVAANAAANANANANSTASSVNSVTPASLSYTNEGMDDTVGMRKISMNGRSLYLSSDDGVFEREGNSPGDFLGRLVDGKLVEEEAPELPEYS